ncbi:MAG TPA: response regulator [Ktedonobacteraceae bacterium]|jgi:CheY-like chemotaxis protein|nr:response regulator [Ktedonobacteraceae bacterium]
MVQVGLLEDNTRIAKLSATMLQHAGYCVTIYEHPRACLDALLLQPLVSEKESAPTQPANLDTVPVDVLILDLNLPDIDGLAVVRELLSHPRTQALPLIFCTAASASEIFRALRIAPLARAIGKPFTFQELTSAVALALTSTNR